MPPAGARPLRDPGVLSFRAPILGGEKTSCRLVQFPFVAADVFGRKGVVDVRVKFNGTASPGPLYNPGKGRPHFLLLRKELRLKLGVDVGDEVDVEVRAPPGVGGGAGKDSSSPAVTQAQASTAAPTAAGGDSMATAAEPARKRPAPGGAATALARPAKKAKPAATTAAAGRTKRAPSASAPKRKAAAPKV